MKKKGISPLIASVMLLVFVLVISALVMNWMKRSVEVQMESGEVKTELVAECTKTSIRVISVECDDANGDDYDVIVSNTGKTVIKGIQLIVKGDRLGVGSKEEDILEDASSSINIVLDNGVMYAEEVEIIPKIEEGLCEASAVTTRNIKEC